MDSLKKVDQQSQEKLEGRDRTFAETNKKGPPHRGEKKKSVDVFRDGKPVHWSPNMWKNLRETGQLVKAVR